MRPTKRHFLEVSAAEANAAEFEDLSDFSEYEKMLRILTRHKKDLKQIQSTERKADFKKKILPDYLPWIEGALSAGNGKQDNVLMTWCVWAIDCKEYHLALNIAEYAVFHDLQLPDPFTRTLGHLSRKNLPTKQKPHKPPISRLKSHILSKQTTSPMIVICRTRAAHAYCVNWAYSPRRKILKKPLSISKKPLG